MKKSDRDYKKDKKSYDPSKKERSVLNSVKARNEHQKDFLVAMHDHDITFGIGPAGTGKTFLATAVGLAKLLSGEVERLVITRPVIEAGEKLGFLPGTFEEKLDPYIRPITEFLGTFLGHAELRRLMENRIIEIAPLAYMRGRTFENAFVILDEAQNTSPMQMKMFLTRIGIGSKLVITGDPEQSDIRGDNGLAFAIRCVLSIEEIGVAIFDEADVVRHPIIEKILKALQNDASP